MQKKFYAALAASSLLASSAFAAPSAEEGDADTKARTHLNESGIRARMADADDSKESLTEQIRDSAKAYKQLVASEKGVPREVLKKAECIAIFPNVTKVAFIGGGRGGKGIAACKTSQGWSKVAFMRLTGASVGFQAGVEQQDLVLFFMSPKAAERLQDGKLSIGTDISAVAGPYGGSFDALDKAMTNIVAYSHGNGVFAGASLAGTDIRPDDDQQELFYGKKDFGGILTTPAEKNLPAVDDLLKSFPS